MITRLLLPILLAAAIAALVVVGIGQLGSSGRSTRTEREVVTASDGLVQSTVTGTGNVEPVTEDDVDFQTSGTLSRVDVKDGEHVSKGQLLATLDDATDVLELTEARASLAEAQATLTGDETKLADTGSSAADTGDVDDDLGGTTTTTTTTPETTTGTARTSATATTSGTNTTSTSESGRSAGSTGTSTSSGSSTTVTAATVDSDKLTVDQDEATVKEDEQSVAENRLTAPASGTITSLQSISPGDSVTAGSASSAAGASSSTSAGSAADDTTSTSSDSSTSTSFATIDSLRSLSMTVSFTEADISKLKVGQPATVTLDALSGVELAGTVTAVSSLGTTDDDVVSYDATITLDQHDSSVKPGMSASADVIVESRHGVTVPSAAVTGTGTLASVTEQVDGKDETKEVIVGLRGTDEDLVVSGVSSGAQLVETETLPATGSSSTSSSSASTGTESGRGLRAGGAGGGFPGGAGGGFGGGAGGGFGGGR